jgi:limonene-1,2-epoxide hydrolase
MVYDGGPVYSGPDEVEAATRPFLAKYERVDFKILRTKVMGMVTMHERTEDYYAPGGELDTHWHVTGLLVIKDGKIVIWRDYGIPGAKSITGPTVTQK